MGESEFLKPREAAALLGVSRPTLSILVDEEGLPCVLLRGGGGRRRLLRFRASDLVAWIEARRKPRHGDATTAGGFPNSTKGKT